MSTSIPARRFYATLKRRPQAGFVIAGVDPLDRGSSVHCPGEGMQGEVEQEAPIANGARVNRVWRLKTA
jgi:hypothetical protein